MSLHLPTHLLHDTHLSILNWALGIHTTVLGIHTIVGKERKARKSKHFSAIIMGAS